MDVPIVPYPAEARTGGEHFTAEAGTTVRVPSDPDAVRVGSDLAALLAPPGGPDLPVVVGASSLPTGKNRGPAIRLETVDDPELGAEGYLLAASAGRLDLRAATAAGYFYGLQTVRQIAREGTVPAMWIRDRPRFRWRGVMLDLARHFLPVRDVLRLIDLAALHKLNVLHLHLTDDQGWRLEVRSRPELTTVGAAGSVGGGPGGHLSLAEYAGIVAYAAERHVTVVPEIDLPGHTNAALSVYADLNADGRARPPYTGTDVGFSSLAVDRAETYAFVTDVLTEVARSSPGPYLHIGGDEALSTAPADYVAFLTRVLPIVSSLGKVPVGWQEIVRAELPPGTLVQYWDVRVPQQARSAIEAGARLVMSPADHVYLDMKYDPAWPIGADWAGVVGVQDSYAWDPAALVEGVTDPDVIGVEAPLWTETVEDLAAAESMLFPRLPAVAEVAWTPRQARRWADFRVRLGAQAPLWSRLGLRYHRSPEIPWTVS